MYSIENYIFVNLFVYSYFSCFFNVFFSVVMVLITVPAKNFSWVNFLSGVRALIFWKRCVRCLFLCKRCVRWNPKEKKKRCILIHDACLPFFVVVVSWCKLFGESFSRVSHGYLSDIYRVSIPYLYVLQPKRYPGIYRYVQASIQTHENLDKLVPGIYGYL